MMRTVKNRLPATLQLARMPYLTRLIISLLRALQMRLMPFYEPNMRSPAPLILRALDES